MKNQPPKTIYLQCYDEEGNLLDFVRDNVTWCIDQINENDAIYILATQSARQPQQQEPRGPTP